MKTPTELAMLPGIRGSVAALLLVLSACAAPATSTPDEGSPSPECAVPVDGVVHITADDIQFSHDCIRVPADEPFAIELTNLEDQAHNVQVFNDETKSEELARGELITGPNASTTLQVPALAAGEYYFDCLVHPAMNGSLIAE